MISLKFREPAILLLLILVTLGGGAWLIKDTGPLVDESGYYVALMDLLDPSLRLGRIGSVLPGYIATLAGFVLATGQKSGEALRIYTTILSFFTLLAFYVTSKKIRQDNAFLKTFQFLFFPALFPFFFLIYSDIYSLLWIFLTLLALLNRRFWIAGFLGLMSVFVRQNNIIWCVFFMMIIYAENYAPGVSRDKIKRWAKDCFSFILAGIFFGGFALANRGAVYGDRAFQSVTLNLNNIAFSLFLFFFLFLPHNAAKAGAILEAFKKNRLLVLGIGIFFVLYLLLFNANHFYNDARIFPFFLRNRVLDWITSNPGTKILAFFPIAYSIASIAVTRLEKRSFYLLYPFWLLFLCVLPLIEQRYYLIPYTLFLLFKEKDSRSVSGWTCALYLTASLFIFMGVRKAAFFL